MGNIDILNTTNGLEGIFGHIKAKVNLNRGLKKEKKIIGIIIFMNTITIDLNGTEKKMTPVNYRNHLLDN